LGVGAFATIVGLDRDRAFYPTVLIVIAAYYILFAVMAGVPATVTIEAAIFAAFACAAVIGFRIKLWLVVAALAGHGVFDMFHGHALANPGVPVWWPEFCMAYDVAAAGYLALLLVLRGATAHSIRPFVDAELRAAAQAEAAGEAATSFHHLERAHILGQGSTVQHVRVHIHMLAWAHRHRACQEMGAQIARVIGAAVLTPFGAVPKGNTGGSNVGPFQPMAIPSDLKEILAQSVR
jgi:hypothetical protein